MGMIIREGPAEMRVRMTFEAVDESQTRVTTVIEIPGMDESMDTSFIINRLEQSGRNRKQLIESET
jgi:type II secretory pathway predicted ATPase ExeA